MATRPPSCRPWPTTSLRTTGSRRRPTRGAGQRAPCVRSSGPITSQSSPCRNWRLSVRRHRSKGAIDMADANQFVQGAFSNSDVDSSEDVLILGVAGREILNLSFVVGVANLSAFTVEFRYHSDGDWASMASVAADETTPEG